MTKPFIDHATFAELFPFYIEVNRNGNVTNQGASLVKLGCIPKGDHIDASVRVERQQSQSLLDAPLKKLVLLSIKGVVPKFRGQLIQTSNSIIFLGTPWVTSLEALQGTNLKFSDFAAHDPISDFLILLRTSSTSLKDAKELARKLEDLKDEAESANTTKSNFLAAMSHEIRTPLNIIMGMGDLLMETDVTDEQLSYLRTMSSSSDLLLALISDVLDVSRIESNQISLESISFDLNEIIEDVLEGLASRAFEKGLDIAAQYDINGPRHFKGDPSRIKQIVINLVGNAIKFTERGSVSIEVSHSTTPNTSFVEIKVSDTGIGIAKEKQQSVFERFIQASSSTNRKFGGTGLGLNITQSLVELMGGTITLESALENGSVFSIMLPLEPLPIKVPAPWETAPPHINVCVEAIKTRDTLCSHLRKWGATLTISEHPAGQSDFLIVDLGKTTRAIESNYRPEQIIYLAPFGFTLEKSKNRRQIITRPIRLDALTLALSHKVKKTRKQRSTTPFTISAAPTARVLIVDDNKDNASLLEVVLKRNGYHTTVSSSGRDALNNFKKKDFDLILMDVEMPEMDGIECSTFIRAWEKEQKKKETPILAITAHALKEYKTKCLKAGMNDFLSKPISPRLLKDTVNSWINRCPTVLIVDDSAENRVLTDRMLRTSHKFRVMSAGTAKEAMELAKKTPINAAILDIELPDKKGWELAQDLNNYLSPKTLPILFVTGHDDLETKQRCLTLPNSDIFVKPIKKTSLIEKLTNLLTGESKSVQKPESTDIETIWILPPEDEDVRELLPGYIANRRKEIHVLRGYLEAHDYKNLSRIGHNLKGSGAAYGIPKLSEYGATLERHAKNKNLDGMTSATLLISEYVQKLKLQGA